MKRITYLRFAVWVAMGSSILSPAQDSRPTLHFFGVAYDESPPQGQTVDHYNYAPDNFAEVFRSQGANLFRAIEVVTLKGGAATRKAVMHELRGSTSGPARATWSLSTGAPTAAPRSANGARTCRRAIPSSGAT